jgi:Tfp pilus assembly protein PilO
MKLRTTNKYSQDLRRYYRMPAVQTSLTLVLSLFVMAFFIAFALRPTILSIVSLRKNITESEKTLKTLETKVNNLQKASVALDSIKPFLPTLNREIPNEGAEYSPLIMAVEALAQENNVQLESESIGSTLLFSRLISPFTPNRSQNIIVLPFSVRVIGNYTNAYAFLTQLVSLERIILVESVTVSREASSKNTTGVVALNISGSTYYLADEALLNKALDTNKGGK